jgi:predicted Ser/Thr protein kinase
MALSRQDVILGRALLAWHLADQRMLEDCAEDVRRVVAQGRQTTLGQILIARGFLDPERYQAIMSRLHQVYGESSQYPPEVQQAMQQVPVLSDSGRYLESPPPPPHMQESAVERVVQGWGQAAPQVVASGTDIEFDFEPATVPPVDLRPGQVPLDRSRAGPDAQIRRKLGVPPGQDRFPVGKWIVEEYLDAGSWGIVYRVTQNGGDPAAAFALKVLKQDNPSEEIKQRFVREARTMFKLKHPGIAHVHDAGTTQGLLWFVMDFLDGKNLKQMLEDGGALSVSETLRIMKRLCSAVSYAHKNEVLHRDLKPENVIMVGGKNPVLTDFGLAKEQKSTMNLTMEGQRIGTPLYMAPELLLDGSQASHQSEVYALGAMLYECITGQVPFKAKSILDLVELINAAKLEPFKKLAPQAPSALEKLCRRALDKEPSKRPASVNDLATELARVR